MRAQAEMLRYLMRRRPLDMTAVSTTLDALPANMGAEITVVVDQVRRAIPRCLTAGRITGRFSVTPSQG